MSSNEVATEPDSPPKTLTCQICNASSEWTEGFVTEPRLVQSSRTICVTCSGYRQKYLRYYLYWLRWVAVAVGAGYIFTRSIAAAIVFAVGVYTLTYLAIVLHELGHFAAARLAGIDVPVMSFGGGLRAKVLQFRRTFLILSPTPREGLIIPACESREHFRKKALLITVAGPLANLAMGLLGLFVLLSLEGQHLSNLVGGGIFLWTLINFAFGIGNLAPFSSRTAFGEVKSDGAQILAFRRIPDHDIEKILRHRNILRASIEFAYGEMERCLSIFEEEVASSEDSVLYKTLITAALGETHRVDRGVEVGRRYLVDDSLGLMEKALLQNNLAFTLFLRGNAGDLDEAGELSARAIEVLPMTLSVKGTRGSILIAQGRYREGVELLTDKRFRLETPSHRATVYAIRAEGLARLGELTLARKSLRAAQSLEPANRHLSSAAAAIHSLRAA
jgi:tetratricopeptide (TPR) repeat protein